MKIHKMCQRRTRKIGLKGRANRRILSSIVLGDRVVEFHATKGRREYWRPA